MILVNYKEIKPLVLSAISGTNKNTATFEINLEKLNRSLDSVHLEALPLNLDDPDIIPSERVESRDIPYVSEYFFGDKLEWFTDSKHFATIVCIDKTDIDDQARDMINRLNHKKVDTPDTDYTKIASNLIANYHCYFIMVVSYKSNDPGAKKNSYYINCRANKVVLKDPNYVYNSKDM